MSLREHACAGDGLVLGVGVVVPEAFYNFTVRIVRHRLDRDARAASVNLPLVLFEKTHIHIDRLESRVRLPRE